MNKISYRRTARAGVALLAALMFCGRGNAQPPDPPPQLQSQTQRETIFRISRAYWDILEANRYRPEMYAGKGLVVEYQAVNLGQAFNGDPSSLISDIQVHGPQGQPVRHLRQTREQRLFLSGVNPHWNELQIKIELENAQADWLQANGRARSSVEFKDIPLPAKPGEVKPLSQTTRGELGSTVTLKSIELRGNARSERSLQYVLTVDLASAQEADDLTFNSRYSQGTWMNQAGQPLTDATMRARAVEIPNTRTTRNRQRWEFWSPLARIPEAERKSSMDLALHIPEISPSRKKTENFKQFSFRLLLKDLPDYTLAPVGREIAAIVADETALRVEDWGQFGNQGSLLRLWTRPLKEQSRYVWLVQSLRLESHQQTPQKFRQAFYPPGRSGWLSNGNLARANENSYDFWTTLPLPSNDERQSLAQQRKPAAKLQVVLAEARHAAYTFLFEKLPRPAAGETVPIGKVMKDPSGAELTLLAAGDLRNGAVPAEWPAPAHIEPPPQRFSNNTKYPVHSGIALAFRWKPAGGTDTVEATHQLWAADSQGRLMLDELLDFLLPAAPGKWLVNENEAELLPGKIAPQATFEFTLFILPPAPEVKTFAVRLSTSETIVTGERKNVTVPLPQS